MNVDDFKRAMTEVMSENNAPQKRKQKKGVEFSKWIMVLGFILCGGTWVVAAASWLLWREFPAELIEYTAWYFGAVIAYMFKSGYENRAKILGRED